MRRITLIVLLASIVNVSMQDLLDKLAVTLLDNAIHKLFDRARSTSSLRHTYLSKTTVAKPSHLTVSTSHLSPLCTSPARTSHLPVFSPRQGVRSPVVASAQKKQWSFFRMPGDKTVGQGPWQKIVQQLLQIGEEAGVEVGRGSLGGQSFFRPAGPVVATQIFDEFSLFLQDKQNQFIGVLEEMDGSGAKFSKETWGSFAKSGSNATSGGVTRVFEGGNVIEKGACSFTLIESGVLSSERAGAIQSRQSNRKIQYDVKAGDKYAAAALSVVLHSRSPLIPTFRSDVRILLVSNGSAPMAWFGGGADLTPCYLNEEDIKGFHQLYKNLAASYDFGKEYTYEAMKKTCDEYFYLPARSEYRGTGGIFFDDLEASPEALRFVKRVAESWMPSWLPIVEKRRSLEYTEEQRQWQLLRRGRYLEFNLLYDRGVKVGLSRSNPRVDAIFVSAPPLVAYKYNNTLREGSPEAAIMEVLKHPRDWV